MRASEMLKAIIVAGLALFGAYALATGLYSYMQGWSVGLGAIALLSAWAIWRYWFGADGGK